MSISGFDPGAVNDEDIDYDKLVAEALQDLNQPPPPPPPAPVFDPAGDLGVAGDPGIALAPPPPAPVQADIGYTEFDGGPAFAPAPPPPPPDPVQSYIDQVFMEQNIDNQQLWTPEVSFTTDEEYFKPIEESLFGTSDSEGLVPEMDRLESQLFGDDLGTTIGLDFQLAEAQRRVEENYKLATEAESDEDFEKYRLAHEEALNEYNRLLEQAQGIEERLGFVREEAGPLYEQLQGANLPFSPAGEGFLDQTADLSGGFASPRTGMAQEFSTPEFRIIEDPSLADTGDIYVPQYRSDVQAVVDAEWERINAEINDGRQKQKDEAERQRRILENTLSLGYDPLAHLGDTEAEGFQQDLNTFLDQVVPTRRGPNGEIIDNRALASQIAYGLAPDNPVFDLTNIMWSGLPSPVQTPLKIVGGLGIEALELSEENLKTAAGLGSQAFEGLSQMGNPYAVNRTDQRSRDLYGKRDEAAFQRGVDAYEGLPLGVRLGAEIIFDPLNILPGVGFTKLGVRSTAAAATLNRRSMKYIADAATSSSAVDAAYLDAVVSLDRQGIGFIDSLKITNGSDDFTRTLSRYAKTETDKELLNELSVRLSTRLHAANPSQWAAIRDEEVARVVEKGFKLGDRQVADLNERLASIRGDLSLSGDDFWSTQFRDVNVARSIPPAEAKKIPDLPVLKTITLDDVSAVGVASFEKANLPFSSVFPRRWQTWWTQQSATRTANPSAVIDSFVPEANAGELAERFYLEQPVPENMTAEIRRMYDDAGRLAEYRAPKNLAEAKRMANEINPPRFEMPPGPKVADVISNPQYQTMGFERGMSQRVSPAQLLELERKSQLHGENFLSKLAMPSEQFPAFSHGRHNQIIESLPATLEQQRAIRKMVADRGLDFDLGTLPTLTERSAQQIIESFGPKDDIARRNLQMRIRALRTDDPMGRINLARTLQFREEMKTVFNDMLVSAGKDSPWVGGTRYQNAAGRLRMGPEQWAKAFMKAPKWLLNDPHYGNAIEQIRQFITASTREGGQITLSGEGRETLEAMLRQIPELADTAPESATGQFFRWLDNQYGSSKIVKSAALRQKKFQSVNAAPQFAGDYLQLASEVGIREALLSRTLERLDRYEALGRALSWTDKAGKEHTLDFLNMRPGNARQQFQDFLKTHPDINAKQANQAIREYLRVGNVNLNNMLKEIDSLKSQRDSLGREVRDGRQSLAKHAEEFGYEDMEWAQDFTVTNQVADFAREFNLSYQKAGAPLTNTNVASEVSTADVIHAMWKSEATDVPLPDPLLKPITRKEIGQAEGVLHTSGVWNDLNSLGRIDDLVRVNDLYAAPVMQTISGGTFEFTDEASRALFTIAHYAGQRGGQQAIEDYWRVISQHSLGVAAKGKQNVINEAVRLKNLAQVISRETGEETIRVSAGKVVLDTREIKDKVLSWLVKNQRLGISESRGKVVYEAFARLTAPGTKPMPVGRFMSGNPGTYRVYRTAANPTLESGNFGGLYFARDPQFARDMAGKGSKRELWAADIKVEKPFVVNDSTLDEFAHMKLRNTPRFANLPADEYAAAHAQAVEAFRTYGVQSLSSEHIAALRAQGYDTVITATDGPMRGITAANEYRQQLILLDMEQGRFIGKASDATMTERLGVDQVLDGISMTLRSGSDEAARWAQVEGLDIGPFLRPNAVRPEVGILDPQISALARVEWNQSNGRVFDDIVQSMYQPADALGDEAYGRIPTWDTVLKQKAQMKGRKGVDPIWGHVKGDRLANVKHITDLHDMSKGVLMGDLTESVAHRAYAIAAHPELVPLRPGVPHTQALKDGRTDPYALMRHVLDGIANDDPLVMQYFDDMFKSSRDMDRWLSWFRLKDEAGNTTWDNLKKNWGQFQPHDSIQGLPEPVLGQFATTSKKNGLPYFNSGGLRRFDEAMRLPDGQFPAYMMKPAKDAAKQEADKKVSEALREVAGRDLTRMTDEMVEFDNFRAAFRERWITNAEKLRDPGTLKWKSGVHPNDIDAILLPDAIDKPYDVALLGKRIGAGATEFEHGRLGFDPNSINTMMKTQYAMKRFFGTIWLRAVPRYYVNNFGGTMASVMLHTLRQDSTMGLGRAARDTLASGADVLRRRDWTDRITHDVLKRSGSGMTTPRMFDQGMASTEVGSKFLADRTLSKPRISAKDPRKSLAPEPVRQAAGHSKKALDWYLGKMGTANDWADLGSRRTIYSQELQGRYAREWGKHVDERLHLLRAGDQEFRTALEQAFGVDEVMEVANRYGLSQAEKTRVIRAQNESLEIARWNADKFAREAIRDYSMRTNFDWIADHIFPYHYWTTKNMLFTAKVLKEAPVLGVHWATLYHEWSQSWEGESISQRHTLKLNKLTNPLRDLMGEIPGAGDAGIGNFFFGDPDGTAALRFNNWTNPAVFQAMTVLEDMRQAYDRYDDMSVVERSKKMIGSGLGTFWEESGFRPGIQFTFPVEVGNREDFKKWVDGVSGSSWYSNLMEGYVSPAVNPKDFRTEAIPFAGLEQVPKLLPGVGDDYTGLLTWMNQKVHGSPYSNLQHVNIGRQLVSMVESGEFGELDEQGNLTAEGETRFREALIALSSRSYENDDLQVAIDRMENENATRGARSVSGVSIKTTDTFMAEMFDLNEHYWELQLEGDIIPLPKNGVTKHVDWINSANTTLKANAEERDRRKELADFDPNETLKWEQWYETERQKLYDEAAGKGIYVPQLNGVTKNYASEWAFGTWNPETMQREGGQAHILGIWWLINRDEEALQKQFMQADIRAERSYRNSVRREEVAERRDVNSKRTPYFDDIDATRKKYDASIQSIHQKDIPEASKMFLIENLEKNSRDAIAAIYDKAERDGVELSGAGRLPYQTSRWYDLRDQQHMADEMREIVSMSKKNDTIQAQTQWVMEEVLTSLDIWKYDEDGEINPKYAKRLDDGRVIFDNATYKQDLALAAQQAPAVYRDLISAFDDLGDGALYAKGAITTTEFLEHVNRNVNPVLDEWREKRDAAYADVVSETNRDEKSRKIDMYREEFGPQFMAVNAQPEVSPNEYANSIQERFDLMTPEQQKEFIGLYPDLVSGSGYIRPEKLEGDVVSDIAERYNIEFPLDRELREQENAQQIINDVYYKRLSKGQQDEWRELYGSNTPGLFTEETVQHPESGDIYTRWRFNPEVLTPEELAKIMGDSGLRLGEERGDIDSLDAVGQQVRGNAEITPKHLELLHNAQQERHWEHQTKLYYDGELFLKGDAQDEWKEFMSFIRDPKNKDNEDAAKAALEEHEATWAQLEKFFDAGTTLGDYIRARNALYEDNNIQEHYNRQGEYLSTPEGAELLAHNPDLMDDMDAPGEADKRMLQSGELFLEGEQLDNWQSFRAFTGGDNAEKERAIQEVKEQTGATWKQMIDYFPPGTVLGDYIRDRQALYEEYDMPGLYNQRGEFMKTAEGQRLLELNPDLFAQYAPEPGEGSGKSGGKSGGKDMVQAEDGTWVPRSFYDKTSYGKKGGSGKSGGSGWVNYRRGGSSGGSRSGGSGGFRNSGGGSGGNALPLGNLGSSARSVLELDPIVRSGEGEDAGARREIAVQVAEFMGLWEQKISMFADLTGDRQTSNLLMSLMMASIKKMLGAEPTLEGWQKVLAFLVSKGFATAPPVAEGAPGEENMVMAEDGTMVPVSFYDEVSPEYAAANGSGEKMVMAEDGTMVPESFYANTAGYSGVNGGDPKAFAQE